MRRTDIKRSESLHPDVSARGPRHRDGDIETICEWEGTSRVCNTRDMYVNYFFYRAVEYFLKGLLDKTCTNGSNS